jgi:hypothetical protein
VNEKFDKTLIELRIARAYIKLLCSPDGHTAAQAISIARIGDYEIHLFQDLQTEPAETALFWLELFDHGTQTSIDSGACREIEEAATVFEGFLAEAERLEEARRQADIEPQG